MHCYTLVTSSGLVSPVLSALTVLEVELDGRSVGDLAQPHVKILSFPSLEEKNIVAVVDFGQLVELVQLSLGIELGVFSAVREHGSNIVEKMTVSMQIFMLDGCAARFASSHRRNLTCR